MLDLTKRPLKVFLCHASADKPAVRKLYRYLKQRGVQPWLDEINLLPGQDWQVEIPNALFSSDVIVVCLSKNSIDKEGYVQKEITFALDKALEKPEGIIFIIPARLEECNIPSRVSSFQWVDLFREGGHKRLMQSLNLRAVDMGPSVARASVTDESQPSKPVSLPPITEKALEKIVPHSEPELQTPTPSLTREELKREETKKEKAPPTPRQELKQGKPAVKQKRVVTPPPTLEEKKPALKINFPLLGIAGIVMVVGWILTVTALGENSLLQNWLSSSTPTLTLTPTVSPTSSAPFPYTIQEGDSLNAIAQRFNLGDDGILLILDQNPEIVNANNGVIFVGQTILIPISGTTRPSSTPIPSNLGRGTLIEYRVLPGDTLAEIASRFNSLEQNIMDENNIENANALQVGQILQIPVNLVTATAKP